MNSIREMRVFCCGVSEYDNNRPLAGVEASINELTPELKKVGKVSLCMNKGATDIKNEFLNFVSQASTDRVDTALFYYSGHGYLIGDDMKKLLLAARDTNDDNASLRVGIEYTEVLDGMKKIGASHLFIVLDCCHSGAASKMGATNTYDLMPNQKDIVVFTATTLPISEAWQIEIDGKAYAAFTYFFAKTLKQGIKGAKEKLTFIDLRNSIIDYMSDSAHKKKFDAPNILGNNELQSLPIFNNPQYKPPKLVEAKSIPVFSAQNRLKVLLVKTAIDFPTRDYDFGVPLGLWVLKSYIQLQGANAIVDIFDERLYQFRNEARAFQDAVDNYDVIGVSLCSCEVPSAIQKLKIAKDRGKITFVGGIFCSSNEKYLLDYDCIDYVIPGVSTLPLLNLLRALSKDRSRTDIDYIDGVAVRSNLENFDVWKPSHLPNIELRIWKEIIENYKDSLNGKMDVFTTRGCRMNCAFCSVQKECQHKIYRRDMESVIGEIGYLYEHGFKHFSIKDENFLARGSDYLRSMLKKCHEMHHDITFKIRLRLDDVKNTLVSVQEMADLGVREIQYGIETPNRRLLHNIHKGYEYEEIAQQDVLKKTISAGIMANCSFILGIEGETADDYRKLQDFIFNIGNPEMLKIYINFLTPHPYKNAFPDGHYSLVTNDLKYFTHKIPVCCPEGMNVYTRTKMIETYEMFAEQELMRRYNPAIPKEIRESFIDGRVRIKRTMPSYFNE